MGTDLSPANRTGLGLDGGMGPDGFMGEERIVSRAVSR
jgi:hypothetical protein